MRLDQLLEDIYAWEEETSSTTTTGRLAVPPDDDDDDSDDDEEEELILEAFSAELEAIHSPPPGNNENPTVSSTHRSWKSYLRNKVKELSKDAAAQETSRREEDEEEEKTTKETCAALSSSSSLSSFGRMASFESMEDLENQVRITEDFKLVRIDDGETEETHPEATTPVHPKDHNQGGGAQPMYNQGNNRDEEYHLATDCSETDRSSSITQSSLNLILPHDTQLSDDLPHVSKPARIKERRQTTSSTDQSEMTSADKEGSTSSGQQEMCASPRRLYIIASVMIWVVLALVILFVTLSGKNTAKPASSSASNVPTPSIRQHTSAPTSTPTDQVTLIPTTTLVPRTTSAEQEVTVGEQIEEISLEARVESSSTTNHATLRAEALKQQRLRTEAMWGNGAHQGRPKTQTSSSNIGSKVPYSKKAVQ